MNDNSLFKKRFLYIIGVSAIGIFVLTFLVYTPALKNDFINWDDSYYIYDNKNIHSLNLQSLYWMLTSFHVSNWHPLTWLSLAIDYAFWGLDPLGYHLTNIILHGLNALLVFFLAIKLIVKVKEGSGISSPSKMEHSTSAQPLIVAGVTALLFGLHPLHVESVAWVAERKDLLCAFFVLLSIISYLSYTSSVIKRHRWIWFTLCLLLFILALISKPMAVTLPVILLLLDVYPLNRLVHSPFRNSSVLLEKIPFFVLSIISSVITITAQHSGEAIGSLEQFQLDARLLNALRSLVFYLEKMIVPVKLVPFYPFPAHMHWLDLQYLLSGILILAITGSCLWMVKKGNYLFFIIWLYYVVTLLPVLGIIQVGSQAAADRYTYLPSLGIFLLIAIGISWIFEKSVLLKGKVMLGGLILTLLCIFMFLGQMTVKQIKIWHNSEILWSYVISAFPKSSLVHNNLGITYVDKGMLDDAISEFKKALALDPNYAEAHTNLGLVYFKLGKVDEAIAEYKQAIVIKPDYAKAHNNLGSIYDTKGRLDEAILEYKKVISLNPNDKMAHYNLGLAYQKKGMLDEAIYEYKKALTINPNYVMARVNLGLAYSNKGMLDEAISEFKKAIAIKPNFAKAHTNLGVIYHQKGELDKAILEYKQALAINPNLAWIHNNLAAIHLKKRQYPLAIKHCDKAMELGFKVNKKLLRGLLPYRQ